MILRNVRTGDKFLVTLAVSDTVSVICQYKKGPLFSGARAFRCELEMIELTIGSLIIGSWPCPSKVMMNGEMKVTKVTVP